MTTLYRIKIPCSVCGKEIIKESKMTCSGACRAKFSREKNYSIVDYDGTVDSTEIEDYKGAPPVRKQKPNLGPPPDEGVFFKTGNPPPILEKLQNIQNHKMEVPEFKGAPNNFNTTEKVGTCPHGAMVWENRGLCKYGCTLKGSSAKGKKGKKETKDEE